MASARCQCVVACDGRQRTGRVLLTGDPGYQAHGVLDLQLGRSEMDEIESARMPARPVVELLEQG